MKTLRIQTNVYILVGLQTGNNLENFEYKNKNIYMLHPKKQFTLRSCGVINT